MVDGSPTAGLTVSQRLQRLRDCSARTGGSDLPCESYRHIRGTEEEEGGTAKAFFLSYHTFDDFGGTISYALKRPQRVDIHVVHAPPSSIEGLEARHRRFSFHPEWTFAAVTQDLVITYECLSDEWKARVYLLSLAHTSAHPHAARSTLEVNMLGAGIQLPSGLEPVSTRAAKVQIYGTYVAWTIYKYGARSRNTLEVWNWRLGCLVWHAQIPNWSTYTFIDTNYLAVTLKIQRGSEIPPRAPFWPDPMLRTVALSL